MAHDPAAREAAIELLKAAGLGERVPPRRRDRDPEPASAFTAYTETDGTVLVCWVTPAGGNCASYHEVAKSLKMANAYAVAARGAGWTAELGGEIWHHARLTPPAAERPCEMDGVIEDTHGAEHYWNCGQPGAVTVEGKLLCEDHAGELGYGPKQEEYGFDPNDGLNPTPGFVAGTPGGDLAAKLSAWTAEQGIKPADSAEALAGRLLDAINPEYIAGWLDSGATSYLRSRAEAYASPRELTDAEWAAENHWHGHGTK